MFPTFTEEILGSVDKKVIISRYSTYRIYTPSGKMAAEISVAGKGDYLVRRDAFDRELAKQAVNAGAELRINTRVTGLVKKDGEVIGVTTNSTTLPNIYGKLVIGADGIHAAAKGTPTWAGMTGAGQPFISGVLLELTRLRDIEPEVREYHVGTFINTGWNCINPYDATSGMTHFASMAEFEKVKTGNYAISRKMRDAVPIRMTGWSHPAHLGEGLPKMVADGLILAGSAAGLVGTMHCVVSGHYAAKVALEAIKADEVTAKRLGKYANLCKELIRPGFVDALPFSNLSDEAIEQIVSANVEKKGLNFGDWDF
jgi:flavin-dependent dehydrogenase